MPLSWSISHPHQLVIAVAKGRVDPQEVHRYLQALADDRALPYRKMFDVSEMTGEWSETIIRSFASAVRDRAATSRLGAIALVAVSDTALHNAQLFAEAATVDRPIKIFREQHLARRWLNELAEEQHRVSQKVDEVRSKRT